MGLGRARAAWLGFLVLGGGYFLAIRTLPVEEAVLLPTAQLLQYAESRVTAGRVLALTGGGQLLVTGSDDPAGSWQSFLPGAANGTAFRSIGHNLFALLAGLVGSVVSGGIWARRVARPSPARIDELPVAVRTSPDVP